MTQRAQGVFLYDWDAQFSRPVNIIAQPNPQLKAALDEIEKVVAASGNAAGRGTYRAIRDKRVPRYLAEFEYRFNRRYDLAAMLSRLGWAAVRTPPMPYRLLKLAEAHA